MKKDNIYCNTDKRLFFISDEIDNETMGYICFNLLYLIQSDDENEEKTKNFIREPIKIHINSHGGSVYDMWSLITIMLNSKTPIHTYCTGYAMSAGFNIFLAGGKRFAGKNATFVYHQLSNRHGGKYLDIVQGMDEDTRIQNDIEKFVLSRTKIKKERIDEVREKKIDWYIHSEDFVRLGLCDEIL